MLKVFAVTIVCAAHASGCKIPSIWGGPMIATHYTAESEDMCKRAIRAIIRGDGLNPDDYSIQCNYEPI